MMNGALALVLTFIGLLLGSIQTANGQCSDAKIRECLQILQTVSLSSYTASSLNAACPKFKAVGDCMQRNRCQDSDQRVKLAWVGLRDGFDYICGPGRQTIIAQSTCLSSSAINQGINRCSQQAQQGAQGAASNTAKCRLANTMLTCIRNTVTASCGRDAGRVMAIVTAKIAQPAMSIAVSGCILEVPSYFERKSRQLEEEAFDQVLKALDNLF